VHQLGSNKSFTVLMPQKYTFLPLYSTYSPKYFQILYKLLFFIYEYQQEDATMSLF